jgi:hypothetical protein
VGQGNTGDTQIHRPNADTLLLEALEDYGRSLIKCDEGNRTKDLEVPL